MVTGQLSSTKARTPPRLQDLLLSLPAPAEGAPGFSGARQGWGWETALWANPLQLLGLSFPGHLAAGTTKSSASAGSLCPDGHTRNWGGAPTWQVTLGQTAGWTGGWTAPLHSRLTPAPRQGRGCEPCWLQGQALTSFVWGAPRLPLPLRECCDPPCAVTPGGRGPMSEADSTS